MMILTACNATGTATPENPARNFPTADPNSIALCKPADLKTSSNHTPTNGSITIGISLTNQTKAPCSLVNPPQISLISENKAWSPEIINDQKTITPTLPGLISLSSGESVIISILWQNYCISAATTDLPFELKLSENEGIKINISTSAAPSCVDKKAPNEIIILPYSFPP